MGGSNRLSGGFSTFLLLGHRFSFGGVLMDKREHSRNSNNKIYSRSAIQDAVGHTIKVDKIFLRGQGAKLVFVNVKLD